MHRRPPPRPTTAAALLLGYACLMIAVFVPLPGDRRLMVVLAAAGFAAAAVALVHRLERRHGVAKWEAMWRSRRAPSCMYFACAAVMMFASVIMTARSGGSLLVQLLSMPGNAGMWIGLAIGAFGVVRISGGRFCSTCRYEMSDAIADDSACDRCPECGSFWKRRGGTVADRVTYRWSWIIAGTVVGATMMIGPMYMLSRPALRVAALQILPTGSLIEEAAMGGISTGVDAWNALMARQLTPQEEERLARRLLDGRRKRRFLFNAPDTWLQARVATGQLPPLLARRYVDEHPHPLTLQGWQPPAAPAAAGGSAPPN